MLVRLSVEDFALFERCDMELSPGLNALTGETGAGKSLLLDALDCILGGRASADLVRRGSDEAVVEAFFVIANPSIASAVSALVGRELDGGEILLRRRLSRSGRSTAEVNGHSVPIGVLKQAGDLLVDIHGQNEHQRLIQPSVQLDTLDSFAGLAQKRAVCREAYGQLRDSVGLASATEAERENLQREKEILQHRVKELEAASIASDDELEVLISRRRMAAHHQQIVDTLTELHSRLYEDDDSLNSTIERLAVRLSRLSGVLPDAERWNKILDEAAVLLGEAGREAGEFLATCESAPGMLERIDDRIAALRGLCRKYGPTLTDCRAALQAEKEKLDSLGSIDLRLADARKQAEAARAAFLAAASGISRDRKSAALKLSKKVESELRALGMRDVRFRIDFAPLTALETPEQVADASPSGLDSCDFMLMPNPGEGWAPLRRIASGGEIARAMLALKSVLAGADQMPVLIFDEIDADIGGRLGEAVGGKLRAISASHQVIIVTHLPQIAAFAQRQIRVEKASRAGRTTAAVKVLSDKERLTELAEMLRGPEKAAEALDQAARMLKSAQ